MLALLLLLSGAASLINEHLLSRLLIRVVGSSAEAAAAVLVAFMGGMGLGARWAGRRVGRTRNPLRLYAFVELGIGALALLLPSTLSLVTRGYVAIAQRTGWGSGLLVLRFLVAVAVVAVPGLLMGATLPILLEAARRLTRTALPLAELYAANTFGAACGVLASTYFLVPQWGIFGALLTAASCNVIVCVTALWLDARPAQAAVDDTPPAAEAPLAVASLTLRRGVAIAFGSGLLAFSFEVIAFRLLAVIIGNSVYAFGLMLFVFLLGNAIGSRLGAARRLGHPLALALAQSLVGLSLLALAPTWDGLPLLFRRVGAFTPSFALWEGTRFVVTLALLIGPTLAMGAAFALLLRLAGGNDARTPERVARLYTANMVGAILGSLGGTFVLAPALGSQASLVIVAILETALATLALVPSAAPRRTRLGIGAAWAVAVSLLLSAGSPWNIAALLSGSNVYFSSGFTEYDRLLSLREDRAGGMVAVIEQDGLRTMLANGKFEGNDGFEVPEQQMFALLPLLFVRETHAALNIGIGTANSLAVMGAFPFSRLDAVDLSAATVDAARRQFAHINRAILDDPRVHVHIDDGRNFLLTTDARYDLIVTQLTSIWIGGSADLYNREFYQAARARLQPDGVLQQWIQLHHIESADIARVVATMKSVFPHVTLWVAGHQGVLVATNGEQRADARRLDQWMRDPNLRRVLATSRLDHPFAAFGHLYLDEPGLDAFVGEVRLRAGGGELISTDARSTLEYSTPRGNLLANALGDNMELLRRHATASARAHIDGLTGDAEERLFLAYAARERGFEQLARYVLQPVREQFTDGPHAPLVRALDAIGARPWP